MAHDQRDAIRALCAGDEKELFYSILSRIGDKWSLLVMGNLGKKAGRYTELLDATPGISRRMLTVTLRQLERDGLIERVVHPDVPPWVEYTLTDLGRTLREPALAVATWALEHKDVIVSSRAAYDQATSHLSEVAS
jgi:DNA-binding HxlR family transcriptional regulator